MDRGMAAVPTPDPSAMRLRRAVTIANPQGLHMRPAAAFAEMASRFDATVTVARGDQPVDGKNWLDLLLLAAESGSTLTIEVVGRDALEAMEALARLLAALPEEEPSAST